MKALLIVIVILLILILILLYDIYDTLITIGKCLIRKLK